MLIMRISLFICCLLLTNISIGQTHTKKVINNATFDIWKKIKNEDWTPSGNIVSYEITSPKSDGLLYFKTVFSENKLILERGTNASLHYKDKFGVGIIKPQYDSIRKLKLDKVSKKKFPKDTLAILWFRNDSILKIPNVKSYKLAEKGDWLAYLNTEDLRDECPVYKKWQFKKKKLKCDKPKTSGLSLTVYNPISGEKIPLHQVTKYNFNESGTKLIYSTSHKGEVDSISLHILNLADGAIKTLQSNAQALKYVSFDKLGNQVVYLASNDTNKIKTFQLMYWNGQDEKANILVDSTQKQLKKGWAVSGHKFPVFSENGSKIYFGTNLIVEQEEEDTLLANEKAVVDIWSWTDKVIQPQQLLRLNRSKKHSFLTSIEIKTNHLVQLEKSIFDRVVINSKTNSDMALLINNEPYQKSNSWAFPWLNNFYIINLKNGKSALILDKQGYYPSLSPSTEFLVWYNGQDSTWRSFNSKTRKNINLTAEIKDVFYNDNNGSPYNPYPRGSNGWTIKNNREHIIIKSEFDIWLVDPSGTYKPKCLTNQEGKTNNINYSLMRGGSSSDSVYLELDKMLVKGVDKKSKSEFFSKMDEIGKKTYLEGDHTFYYISQAEKSDKIFYRKMSVSQYPELYVSTLDLKNVQKLTNTNPQQADYNWATVESVEWKSYKGLELEGLLYKPENFDSTKSYPMIVYFYEKYDDRKHNYYSPKPTASIVFPTEYASNGYIVFIPNILYTPGHPAQSAYDCILRGTDYLTDKYNWIDTAKLGLQGQSWGGYQTAQLVTMTDKYACGMAGAPVSNMFSAYGGIRWGSGMSRMFQYERTQSRIGCTIWDCPELYIENSPIFGLPKVNTPLLIMHNDNDGAVPWYQGIEMFMGLRRLEKPVWMLNYNGEQHNLMQNANREDLSLRMRQYFDYYLKDEPMPLWMKNGVDAVDKGNSTNLNLETDN